MPTKVPLILGRRQDLGQVHHPDAGALPREHPADVHQAGVVAGDQHLGAGLADVPRLVGAHRHRGVGVLDREGAAEAAALLRGRQVGEPDPADRLQQPARPVADAEHPQRVAGRVVGHPVREVGADVGHAEHVDEELAELVDPRRGLRDGSLQGGVTGPPGHDRVLVAGGAGARSGRRHDRVVPGERVDERAHHRHRLVEVAGVDHRLRTAGLRLGELHVHPQPAQQRDHGLAGVGEHRVVDAGDRESDTHAAHHHPSLVMTRRSCRILRIRSRR